MMDFVAAMPLLAMRTCVRGCVSGAICFRSGFGFAARSQRLWWVPPSKFRGRRAAHPSDHSSATLRGDVLRQAVLLRFGGCRRGIRDGRLELGQPVSCAARLRDGWRLVRRRPRRQRARERMRGCKQSQGYAKPRHLRSLSLRCTLHASHGCDNVSCNCNDLLALHRDHLQCRPERDCVAHPRGSACKCD